MAMDGATEIDVLIPEIWQSKIYEARYGASKIADRVISVDAHIKSMGDTVHLPIEPTISIGDVTATTGAISAQDVTYTEASLVIDKWRGARLDMVDMANIQAQQNLLTAFSSSFGKALAFDIDEKLAALFTGFSSNVIGDDTADLSEDLLVAAMQELIDLSIPVDVPNDISFIFSSTRWGSYKKIDKFNLANYTGEKMGGMLKYTTPAPFGVPIFFSTAVVQNGTYYENALIHRQALGLGVQKNTKIEQLARTNLATPIVATNLYGVKEVRDNHAVLIKTK